MTSTRKILLIVLVVGVALAALLIVVPPQAPPQVSERLQVKIPASHAYFLLSDSYVITGTERVNAILSEVYHSTRGKTWTIIDSAFPTKNDETGLNGQNVLDSIFNFSGLQSDNTKNFEEFDEMLIYINASGDASCQFTAQVPPSKLADFLKFLTPLVGIDKTKQIFMELVRSSLARYGLEMRNPSCDISTEENFKIEIEWEIPTIARWEDNRWTITLEWIDEESAAGETIADEEDSWVMIRNIAAPHNAQFRVSSRTALVLPENAKNVHSEELGLSKTLDHGGGTYSKVSLYSELINGRHVIVENGLVVIETENGITLTQEQLIENSLFYAINYNGFLPENASFASSVEQIRLDLKYGRELDERYSIYGEESWYSLSPAQVLYYAANAIDNYSSGNKFSIQQPISVVGPDNERGDLKACWKNFPKEEYVSIAKMIRDNISSTSKAPSVIDTSLGRIRFKDVLYTFTRILPRYDDSSEFPNTIIFAPVPTGELIWEYDTAKVSADFAEGLCNWTAIKITYELSYSPPTSEQVLESKRGQCRDYVNVYLALTRTAGIPARRVSGWVVSNWQPPAGWEFVVGETPERKPICGHAWTQIYMPEKEWTPVDPTAGRFEDLGHEIYKQMEQTWMSALAGYETAYGLI